MKRLAGMTAAVTGTAGVLYGINPQAFMQHASDIANNQIAQAGFFFTLAAFIHAGRVKTEIRAAFSSLTDSINSLGTTLSQQLKNHESMLSDHKEKLDKLGEAVTELQKTKQGG